LEEFSAARTLRFRGPIFRLRLTVTFTRNHFDLFQISVMMFVRFFGPLFDKLWLRRLPGTRPQRTEAVEMHNLRQI
jgi:hypothetical protein